jgi:enoyl-[acyl-carrier protein] reductase III
MQGATVFVTGGSRGIGKAIALRFAELGAARVAIGYLRNDRAAEATAEELRANGAEPVLVRGNVSSDRVAHEVAELGPLQALVHNAATGVIRPALETEDKHWDWTLNANARALLSLARAAAPQMPQGSSIVGISSLGSTRVLEDYVLVGTSKAALESLVRYLAVELAPRGIRVNAVSGGVVDTEGADARVGREAHARGPPRHGRGHRKRRRLPLLARGGDDPRPRPRRRRRLHAPRINRILVTDCYKERYGADRAQPPRLG